MTNQQSIGIVLGIFIGVIFALGFIVLDYNIGVSVLLGICGGIASSFLVIWGNTNAITEEIDLEENDLPEEKYAINAPENLAKPIYTSNGGEVEKGANDQGITPAFNSSRDISLWKWLFKNNQRRFLKKSRSQTDTNFDGK